jgi:hypothetical protein
MHEENRLIIKQLNKFGKVPETQELLKMIETYETQQKEFITWLEDNIKRAEMFYQCHMDTVDDTVVVNLKYVLETYKEIIGINKEENKDEDE